MLRDQGTSRNRGMMLTAGEEKKRLQKNVESRPFHQKTLRIKKDKPEKKEAAMSEKNVPKKIYIIDTKIFLHDPEVLLYLKDNYLVIPFTALDELDNFKKGLDELGANSRQVSRYLNKVRNGGDFKNGVTLESGGTLFIDTEDDIHSLSPLKNHADKPDHHILAVALKWQQTPQSGNLPVILVTNDINLLNKASAYGIRAEEYRNDKVGLYAGFQEIRDKNGIFTIAKRSGKAPLPEDLEIMPNEFVIIKNDRNDRVETICKDDVLIRLPVNVVPSQAVFSIKPKNAEQRLALELLLDPDITLVTLTGKAGTGKTLLALAAAFEQQQRKMYSRISVARPIKPMGEDIGFLPGDINEKLNPWMQPIFDNLDILFSGWKKICAERPKEDVSEPTRKERKQKRKVNEGDSTRHKSAETNGRPKPPWQKFIDDGVLYVEPLTYIRGRSLPHQFFIIDEAQNLTGHEIRTIITRAGEGTKIVLTGDINQIDSPYLNIHNNGLSIAIHRFKQYVCSGHIMMMRSERSALAELAANIL